MRRPVRLAFVGVDHPHGAAWRETLRQSPGDVEIVALATGSLGVASLEERYAHLPLRASAAELLAAADFDAALVCLPNLEAAAAAETLAAAGKHLLVEKPCAVSADAWRPVVTALRRSGAAFQSGYLWRYDDGADRLRRMVRLGQFGKLIHVETRFVTADIQRRDPRHYLFDAAVSQRGFLHWLACHWLDLLLYVTGQRVVGVTARTGVFGESPGVPPERAPQGGAPPEGVPEDRGSAGGALEDGGAIILELADGALATFVGGYWLPRWANEQSWSLHGSRRWVEWRQTAGTGGVLAIHGPQPHWHAMEESVALPADSTPGYGGARGVALVNDWLRAIDDRGHACRNTAQSALAALELLDAVYQSSNQGQRVACDIG